MKEYTLSELADIVGVTRQALYLIVSKGRMKAKFDGTLWYTTVEEYENYRKTRYKSFRRRDEKGELVFDPEKGECDINRAAQILGREISSVYYLCGKGVLPYKRKGWTYVFDVEELEEFAKKKT